MNTGVQAIQCPRLGGGKRTWPQGLRDAVRRLTNRRVVGVGEELCNKTEDTLDEQDVRLSLYSLSRGLEI